MLSRRHFMASSAATVTLLAAPSLVRAQNQRVLKYIPVIDLAMLDPVAATAQVSRTHGFMVFDTLYGMDTKQQVHPQMVDHHTVSDDGKEWTLILRDGLMWHDGEKVTARDCVASILRWSKRDAAGDALMQATDELSAPDDKTIRFRLKAPFPYVPYVLGKVSSPVCFMMPERIANTDPFQQITEIIGSGPYRYVADERLPGARNVYQRFEGYKPREDGVTDWTSGPKVVHFDRVEWTTMPDAATGTAAMQAGEQDWQDTMPHDLLPIVQAFPDLRTMVLDDLGFTCAMRVNHLQAPFNNPDVRRALMGAIDQQAFMTAVVGDNPDYMYSPLGYFTPGTPFASEAGLDVLRGPRDYAAVKAALTAAGYNGEKVVLLVPADSLAQKPLGDIAFDVMQKAGMNVEYAAMDFASVLKRRTSKEPVENGGWSAFVGNWQGIDWLSPLTHNTLRGDGTFPGWYQGPEMEVLRNQWLATADAAEQKALAVKMQEQAFHDVPYYPIGQYKQPTLYRADLEGILKGTPVFWNVRRA
ncbi:ABC transporter substrate-binding protein [Sinirhodobacter populi]|uniref:ABC transporter substrate-binding protein n=1 Tax=Paenirhodobacter populi TaxID=2306993 RepID=A0A443KNY0_9RHOB|nr:ABC transporter substrate-binding protein [Sinirhodobacter populi]RWR34557.1 ABC transporter substrate-binding protein [Sinirhodobacter populi]